MNTVPGFSYTSSEKEFVVSTDAFKYAVGAILERDNHPMAYILPRLSDTRTTCGTGDQDLLAFFIVLKYCST